MQLCYKASSLTRELVAAADGGPFRSPLAASFHTPPGRLRFEGFADRQAGVKFDSGFDSEFQCLQGLL
jgi:hypothetical protein